MEAIGTILWLAANWLAFVAFVCACATWFAPAHGLPLPSWRRRAFAIGLLAILGQAAVFVSFFTPLSRQPQMLAKQELAGFLLFLIAVPCALAGRGKFRWWIPLTSAVVMVDSLAVLLAV